MDAIRLVPWVLVLASWMSAQEPAYRMLRKGGGTWSGEFLSLRGTPEAPQAGDYWDFGGLPVLLPEPGEFEIDDALRGSGELAWTHGGVREIVGLAAARLPTADEATLRGLRCVRLDAWSPEIAAALAKVPPAAGIAVLDGALQGERRALPPLPEHVQCVRVICTEPGGAELSPGATWRELRVLEIGGYRLDEHEVDLAPFAAASELRVLRVTNGRAVHADVVGKLVALRDLELSRPDGAPVSALSGCRELRRVAIRGSPVGALDPLAELPELVELGLFDCALASTPSTGFPNLRKLDIRHTGLPPAALLAFLRAHPTCETHRSPSTEDLHAVLGQIDRVRVLGRDRRGAKDQVLVDVADAAAVREIVGCFEVDGGGMGWRCMCGGEPKFEFLLEGRLIALVSLHHACSIRWVDGPWDSDAALLADRADAIANWLAAHGVERPQLERETLRKEKAARLALTRRAEERRSALLGAKAQEVLRAAEAGRVVWEELGSTDGERVHEAFGLLGCHDERWPADRFDRDLADLLSDRRDTVDWLALASAARSDELLARGFAAWFVMTSEPLWGTHEPLGSFLQVAIPAGLANPEPQNRVAVLTKLLSLGETESLPFLRRLVAGEFAPRARDVGEAPAEPGDDADARTTSAPLVAALELLKRGDWDSLPAIRVLATQLPGRAGASLRAALEISEARRRMQQWGEPQSPPRR